MLRRNASVATVAIVTLVAVATLLLGILGIVNYISESRSQREKLDAEATTMANQLSAGLALPLWNFDRPQIDKILEGALQVPDVYAVVVRQRDVSAPDGVALYAKSRDSVAAAAGADERDGSPPPFGLVVKAHPVVVSDETLGTVKVCLTTKLVEQRLRGGLISLAVRIVGLDLLLVLSLYVLLRQTVLLPLRAVERYASQVSSGAGRPMPATSLVPAVPTGPRRFSGEIESLRSSVERMIVLLDERYTALQKSQSMLTCILNTVPLYIFWKDREGRYLGCNEVFARAAGVANAEAIVGRTDFDLPWARDGADLYRSVDRQVVETGKPRRHVVERRLPADGIPRWMDTSKVPLLNSDGKTFGVLGVLEDVTERMAAEEQYRLLFENTLTGIAIFDVLCDESGAPKDYRLVQANVAFDRLTGLQREQEMGKTRDELTFSWPPDLERRFLDIACSGGGEPICDRFNESLGRHYEVQAFSPRRGQFALVFNDVTEQKRGAAALLESEKLRTVAGLAAGMAHEINNPLAGMLQNAQVALNRLSADTPASRRAAEEAGTSVDSVQDYVRSRGILEMLQMIRAAGERAAGIVSNMLSFSRADAGPPELHELAELLDRALDLARGDYDLRRNYDFRNIQVVTEYAAGLPGVPCRASEIQQVVLNLLTNAAQAMADRNAGGDPPRIVLRTLRDRAFARIEIEDNGPGVPEDVRRRMFEPFFTTKGPQEGTGLGLFVAYFIITRNHGGSIAVESHVDVGTKFTIRLPLRADDDHDS